MVKKTRILVLDEASANVDPATDSLIRETIRTKFKDCTVLTVAHRLESVIDSDMILVIDDGKIIEFDQPHVLLNRDNGLLASMAKQGGDAMLQHFKKVAEEVISVLFCDLKVIKCQNISCGCFFLDALETKKSSSID